MATVAGETEECQKSADQVYREHPDVINDDGVFLIPGSTSEEPKEESPQASPEEWNEMDKISDD